jgi:hypothetical protein
MSEWNEANDQAALTLAAIRWYAMSIEKLAQDLYITHRSMYPAVQAALDKAMNDLEALRNQLTSQALDGGCPPGYKNCDGFCLPVCPGGGQY